MKEEAAKSAEAVEKKEEEERQQKEAEEQLTPQEKKKLEKQRRKKEKEKARKKKRGEPTTSDEEEPEGETAKGMESKFDEMNMDSDSDEESGLNAAEKAVFAEAALQVKESKLMKARNTKKCYLPKNANSVGWFAWKLQYGLGKRDPRLTEVTPYIYIGDAQHVAGMQYLIKLGITHVLNVTCEVSNHYPPYFVYQRIPIKDSLDEDVLTNLPTAIQFLQRVWQRRGKVFVHCTQVYLFL